MKNNTLNIKGRSGKNYVFHLYKLPARLSTVGGVYFYLKPQKGDYKILKLGSTHNFEDELQQSKQGKKYGASYIAAMRKNTKGKQDQMTQDLKYLLR